MSVEEVVSSEIKSSSLKFLNPVSTKLEVTETKPTLSLSNSTGKQRTMNQRNLEVPTAEQKTHRL